jgi:hypothetical protein
MGGTPQANLDLAEPTVASPKAMPRTECPRLGRAGIGGGASTADRGSFPWDAPPFAEGNQWFVRHAEEVDLEKHIPFAGTATLDRISDPLSPARYF